MRVRYGDGFYAYVNRGGKYLIIRIPMYVFERYEDIKGQVIEVLCRKLERTKDEKKRQAITKHLKRLTPTKRAAAVDYPEDFSKTINQHYITYLTNKLINNALLAIPWSGKGLGVLSRNHLIIN